MLDLILHHFKPTILTTSSEKLSKFLVNELINYKYSYSDNVILENFSVSLANYSQLKEILSNDSNLDKNFVVVTNVDYNVLKDIVNKFDLEIIDLDNVNDKIKIKLISSLVFLKLGLRSDFSSDFWINLLKIISNNFFELYFIYKVISSNVNEKESINRHFFYRVRSYLEDNFSDIERIDFYPDKKNINDFLYFLLNPMDKRNFYKGFMDFDLLDRIYHKYLILSDLSTKNFENLIIDSDSAFVANFINVFSSLGQLVFITSLNDFLIPEDILSDKFGSEDFSYVLDFIFLILDKKILYVKANEKSFLFYVKSIKVNNMESIRSFLKRYSIDFQDIRFIFYSYSEVYNKLINFVILNLSDNLELSYRILSTSILAKNSEYYNNFGFVNIAKGNLDKAKDYILKRLSFDPKDVLANYNLAVVYWLQKDYVSALDVLKNKFLFVDEPNSASFSVVIPIYPFDKKVFLFDVKIDVLIKASLANLLFLSGQKEEAIKIFSKISIDYLKVTPSFYNYLLDSKNYIENN